MKQYLFLTIFCLFINIVLNAQGAEFGYMFETGSRSNFRTGQGYNQYIESTQHNLYIKFHKKEKKTSLQWSFGIRRDTIYFSNYANYYSTENNTVEQFHNQGYLIRNAVRLGFSKYRNFGNPDGHLRFSVHYGLYYDATIHARRINLNTETNYSLNEVLNPSILGLNCGSEVSYRIFTLGFKFEKPFKDLINHNYIKTLPKNTDNATELQGLRLDSWLSYIYCGLHINF